MQNGEFDLGVRNWKECAWNRMNSKKDNGRIKVSVLVIINVNFCFSIDNRTLIPTLKVEKYVEFSALKVA